jgi:hypothetical protein
MAKIERLEDAMLRQRRARRDHVRHLPSR